MKKTILSIAILLAANTAIFAQAKEDSMKMHKHNGTEAKMYCCSMHHDVISNKPGKCAQCGSALVLTKKEEMKMGVMKLYSCPMHPDMVSNKAGKCHECGMDLTEVKAKSKAKKN